ncbi:MAG: ATP-binding protein [Crocinitomicaceae bacterium]
MENPFKIDDLSKNLSERVKELECLYNVSRIAIVHKNNVDKAIDLILNEIPKGWQFPERMGVYLEYGDVYKGEKNIKAKQQSVHLDINKELKGELTIYFKKELDENSIDHFLPEEQSLLNQIGHEVSGLIDLDIRVKREKAIQEQLLHNDRLKLLSEITAGIAHEINTPLNNIIGYSQLLNKSQLSKQDKQDVEKVIKSAKHAREIVKKLMFFSCEMPSNFIPYNLNNLLNESLDLIKLKLNEKSIQINLKLDEQIPLVDMDPNQFTQVIFNIVLNAIDAMKLEGMLSVSTSYSNNDVRLRISDNGSGMTEEQKAKVFQPFYTNKKNNQGTGLGLAVSHGIVQAHGGRIEIDSTIGKGTTFTIILTKSKNG